MKEIIKANITTIKTGIKKIKINPIISIPFHSCI